MMLDWARCWVIVLAVNLAIQLMGQLALATSAADPPLKLRHEYLLPTCQHLLLNLMQHNISHLRDEVQELGYHRSACSRC